MILIDFVLDSSIALGIYYYFVPIGDVVEV